MRRLLRRANQRIVGSESFWYAACTVSPEYMGCEPTSSVTQDLGERGEETRKPRKFTDKRGSRHHVCVKNYDHQFFPS